METVTIIPVEQTISTALETQNVTKQVLAELKKYNTLKIAGLDDKAGYEAVDRARKQCKSVRVLAEKCCKAGREDAIKIQKAWIAKEKEIVSEIEETESYLQDQQDNIDNEKKRIEDEKREAERLRIQNRIDKLTAVGYALDFAVVSTISDEQFEQTLTEATALHNAELERLANIEKERLAEVARIEAMQVEQEKERKRLEAIEREQQEREAKIKADQQAEALKLQQEREAIEREKAAIEKAKQDAIDAEARRVELEAAKKLAAEQALKDAEEKRVADEKAAEVAKENAAREQARLEALKPEKEKLKTWFAKRKGLDVPTVAGMSPEVIAVFKSILDKDIAFEEWAKKQIDSIA